MSAPLALPLRGSGANGGHADRPRHGAAIGANVGGSTSTFASRFAHRPLPTPEVAAALFANGSSVYCITDVQAAQQRNVWGVGFNLVIVVFAK